MERKPVVIAQEALEKEAAVCEQIKALWASRGRTPRAFVDTYGCQQNEADSEKLRGYLRAMGFDFTQDEFAADVVVMNTCAVREHAEQRVFGNVGALKGLKEKKPGLIIGLCGCMANQKHVVEKLRQSYPYVDLVFGVDGIDTLPQLIAQKLQKHKRVLMEPAQRPVIVENIPIRRESEFRAWLPIMYGCDNFCTYCIVPYVRGRERSREPQAVLNEAEDIIANGYKDITLLGQNVNSYGKNNVSDMNFAGLLREVANLDGDFWVRFMTSHPKDCTKELIDVMAENDKIAKHLHLPFQSGNDRVLKAMNRHYDRKKYLELINYAKEKIPDLSLTSDVIVGFPGETYEEFKDTLSLIKEVEFTSLFTFIYSPREGTKAASMEDPVTKDEKSRWFKELCDLQESIASKRTAKMKDNIYKVLVESESKNHPGMLSGRTEGNIIIEFSGDSSLIGSFRNVKVTEPLNWILKGELQQ